MMNSYLYSVLGKTHVNSYTVNLSITLPFHFNKQFNAPAKIDTGCAYTNFSYKALENKGVALNKLDKDELIELENKAKQYKKQAIDADLATKTSFGVNDSIEYINLQKELYRNKNYLDCTAISFIHPIKSIYLGGYEVPVEEIKISYDRPKSILIGMDILKNFDIHTGISKVNGENVLIGCLRDNITPEYLTTLEEHFGYTLKERVIAELVRDGFLIPKHKI